MSLPGSGSLITLDSPESLNILRVLYKNRNILIAVSDIQEETNCHASTVRKLLIHLENMKWLEFPAPSQADGSRHVYKLKKGAIVKTRILLEKEKTVSDKKEGLRSVIL